MPAMLTIGGFFREGLTIQFYVPNSQLIVTKLAALVVQTMEIFGPFERHRSFGKFCGVRNL